MPRHPASTGSEPLHVSLVAIPEAAVSTLSGIFDVMNAFAILPPSGDAPFRAPPPFQVEIVGLQTWPAGSRQQPAGDRCSAVSPRSMQTDIVIVPSILLGPEGWQKGRHPELVDWLRAMHRPRRAAVLGLLGYFPARRDGAVRRHGCDGAFWLRPRLRGRLSAGADPPGARPRHLRQARGADHLGRLHDLARSGAVPDSPPCRSYRGADRCAVLRPAMASGRPRALHRLRGAQRSWRPSRSRPPRTGSPRISRWRILWKR